jgi:NAD(P)-dependent dehydrogenase (short-subunit alcohol dehydrogenase family)
VAIARTTAPVALVTGGGSGIGRSTCIELGRRGYRVVVSDVDPGAARGPRDASPTRRWTPAASRRTCDGPQRPLADIGEAEWTTTIAVDLTGGWLCLAHEIRALVTTGGGAIVNVSSVAGLIGVTGAAPEVTA